MIRAVRFTCITMGDAHQRFSREPYDRTGVKAAMEDRMKKPCRIVVFIAAIIAVSALSAQAWLRVPYEDAQIVERSDLIVIASIKEGSVIVVPHPRQGDEGRSWETHATLLIHEVIKGECKEKELPIVIQYGLDVSVDAEPLDGGSVEKPTTLPIPKKSMQIVDTGDSDFGGPPVADDARKDHVWLLRTQPHDGTRYIADPEDVQPLALAAYLASYLKADPEPDVRAAMQSNPEIAARALRYLQHRQVERILKEPDQAIRVERLLPYYQSHLNWGLRDEAREGIVAAGKVAGPYLMALYQRPSRDAGADIIRLMGEIRYQGSAKMLIDILTRQDRFWAGQKLDAGWWNAHPDSSLTQERREYYGVLIAAVYSLGNIADSDARESLERTRARWASFPAPENAQMLESCDRALRALGKPAR
jgi:hypothetical protein